MTQNPKARKEKIDKLDNIEIKNLYIRKDIIGKLDRQITNWEKYLQLIHSS